MKIGRTPKILLLLALIYMAFVVLLCYRDYVSNGVWEADQEKLEDKQDALARIFAEIDGNTAYGTHDQEPDYVMSENGIVKDTDKQSVLERHGLPALERMGSDDAARYMAELQVLDRINVLGVDTEYFCTPEYNWKEIYSDSLTKVRGSLAWKTNIVFSGTTASELNKMMAENEKCIIKIVSDQIVLDEIIRVPSDVILQGNGVRITGDKDLAYGFLLEKVENAGIYNVKLCGGCQQGIYVIESSKLLLWNNEITNCMLKAICVMGDCRYINLVNNSVHDNYNGGIFLDGDISHCILQNNSVFSNRGTRNLNAGITLCSIEIDDIYTPYNVFKDIPLREITEAPHDNVVIGNLVRNNDSSGIYSDGGYMNYILDNLVEDNKKEGMCLDYGTFGTYVHHNTFRRNGERDGQTDEDLEADFILQFGRLPDGASPAKLPGISLDNAAYNIISDNYINCNSGSGIKMVRSAYRNIILANTVEDNNAGENYMFHGFGVEIGYADVPDEAVIGLDFTPAYENIIARNIILGQHYSGIYLADQSYCNDLIENMMQGCSHFSVENLSSYTNNSVGNISNIDALQYTLK